MDSVCWFALGDLIGFGFGSSTVAANAKSSTQRKGTQCEKPRPLRLTLGGAEGIRTPDLLSAIQARSQLRHSPTQTAKLSRVARGGQATREKRFGDPRVSILGRGRPSW